MKNMIKLIEVTALLFVSIGIAIGAATIAAIVIRGLW